MKADLQAYLSGISRADQRFLARGISLVENGHPFGQSLLLNIKPKADVPVIGVTGPPGAGKSTLVHALVSALIKEDKRIAILAVDPSSPFNNGALLGDRIRMTSLYTHPLVFIRSLASRGALGGLTEKTIEITDILRASNFDYIFIETVGVGQSELDIVGLADLTLLVLVPESGDDVQQVKSGIMEIADVFIVNKSDRPDSDKFARALKKSIKFSHKNIPVINVVASGSTGIDRVLPYLKHPLMGDKSKQVDLIARKAWRLMQQERMRDINWTEFRQDLVEKMKDQDFNLYSFIHSRT